jgi:hypothetical protein
VHQQHIVTFVTSFFLYVKILAKVGSEGKSWKEAFLTTLPARKGAVGIGDECGNDGDAVNTDGDAVNADGDAVNANDIKAEKTENSESKWPENSGENIS